MSQCLTLRLTRYFLRQELTRKRWLLFGSIFLLFSLLSNVLLRVSTASPGTLNFWDGLFSMTAPYQTVLFLLVPFFIVAVIDNLYGYEEQNIFLRISSKVRWYVSKVLVLLVQVVLFTFLFYAIPALISLWLFPYENDWSRELRLVLEGQSTVPVYFFHHAYFARLFPPLSAFFLSVVLTLLSLMVIGLLNLLLYLWIGQSKTLVVVINVLYLVLNHVTYHYVEFGWLKYIVIYDYMILTYYFYKPGQPDLLLSMGGLAVLLVLIFMGSLGSLRRWSIE